MAREAAAGGIINSVLSSEIDAAVPAKWRTVAQATAWKDLADRNASYAAPLKLAEAVA